jgi:DNA sulfur modification protein DndD
LYDEAGTLSQNHSFSRIKSLINEFKSRDPVDEYVKIEKKKGELKVALSDQETKLAAIEQRLNNDSPDDIIEKRKSIDARRGEIKQNSINIASLNTEIETNEERLKKFENSRDDANKNNDKYQDLLEKQKFINDVKNNLVSELNKYRDNARAEVTSTINEILTNTARRPYKAEIEEDFTLRMFYDDSEKIIKPSRGEHKLLALSFVSALLKFSKNRISNTNHFLKPGTVAPLMLDSPFGDLDGTYREGIAKYLQGNTEQLILFLSSSQIKETINVLKEFIGKEYVMVIHNMSSQHGEKDFEDYETTKGDTMNSVEFDKEIDRTAIVEV